MRVLVRIGVNSVRRYDVDVPEDGQISHLRNAVGSIENVDPDRINFIVSGTKIEDNEIELAGLPLDKGVIVIIGRDAKNEQAVVIKPPSADPYEVSFAAKPLGIRIQSNKNAHDAYIIGFETDGARNSGVRLGSKIVAVNGEDVLGRKTIDIEKLIMNTDCPLKMNFLPVEGIGNEELLSVEGLPRNGDEEKKDDLPEKWVMPLPEKAMEKGKTKYDYVVQFTSRPFGTVVFSGKGGKSAYIVSFEENSVAPKLGVRAGSKIVAVGELDVEPWAAQHIQNEIMSRKLPVSLTLRGPEGLTAMEFPVSQSEVENSKAEAQANGGSLPKAVDPADDCFIAYFNSRPLGFGIMSPLGNGAMVSSVQDRKLQEKGIIPGTPILRVGGKDVGELPLARVARMISETQLPMMIEFSREQYFEEGDKVLVQYNDQWYQTTITDFNAAHRKLSVKYDNKPFRFKNSEVIQDFTRIRKAEDFARERILSIHT